MIFAEFDIAEAEGLILAHSLIIGDKKLRKGHVLTEVDTAALTRSGLKTVTAVKLESSDVHEDEAAENIASRLVDYGIGVARGKAFTGRCNLTSTHAGVAVISKTTIDAINHIDESITIATVSELSPVTAGQLLATIKIIPFSVPQVLLEKVLTVISNDAIRVHPFANQRAILIQTRLTQTSDKLISKMEATTRSRLSSVGISLEHSMDCAHTLDELATVLENQHYLNSDLILISAASAIVDREDVVPAALCAAGGSIEHFGMPVDPGNLLLLGRLQNKPVIGLPGCARSPKYNGLDIVLSRIAVDLPVTGQHIMDMGVGGLLSEIPSRPQPRQRPPQSATQTTTDCVAIVLAAGQSRRMGSENKLLATVDDEPILVLTLQALVNSHVSRCLVVTGHESEDVRDAVRQRLSGNALDKITWLFNPDYNQGLSTSLKTGLKFLGSEQGEKPNAFLVALGDMPGVTREQINALVGCYNAAENRLICVPTWRGKRGNPILWDFSFAEPMLQLHGDTGARHLIGEHESAVIELPMDDAAVLTDIDTPEALNCYLLERSGQLPSRHGSSKQEKSSVEQRKPRIEQ